MAPSERPRLAVWKFASCDGCQLSLLDLEDDLMDLAQAVSIAYFPELTSAVGNGPYDISIVEGSVTTAEDGDRLRTVRSTSRFLVTVGACATSGGIQALRNFGDLDTMVAKVYPKPAYVRALATSTPISAHVSVDFELRGCPVDRHQILEVVTAYLAGRAPRVPSFSVCQQCKTAGNVCVLVAGGTPCLGPVTRAGCGGLCPGVGRGCFGCFGPAATVNTASLAERLASGGSAPAEVARMFRGLTAGAPEFAQEAARHEP